MVPDTVAKDYKEQLGFMFELYSTRVLSLEMSGKRTPNWFGVGYERAVAGVTFAGRLHRRIPRLQVIGHTVYPGDVG